MAKTEFLQIRMTPEDSRRLSRVAEADHLDESTWARQAILDALDAWDARYPRGRVAAESAPVDRRQQRRVAEGKPQSATRQRDRQVPVAKAKRPSGRKRSD